MEDLRFKEWRKFFQVAGMKKNEQVEYAKSFTEGEVNKEDFCKLVARSTEAGLLFMERLGVKPVGHQIQITNQALLFRRAAPEIQLDCCKIEDEKEVEQNETIHSSITPSPHRPSSSKISSNLCSLHVQNPANPSSSTSLSGCPPVDPSSHQAPPAPKISPHSLIVLVPEAAAQPKTRKEEWVVGSGQARKLKRVPCPVCGKTVNGSSLKRHQETVHKPQARSQAAASEYRQPSITRSGRQVKPKKIYSELI